MKPLSPFSSRLTLGVCCLLGCCLTALGQYDEYYAKTGEAPRGYWKVKTDYATRGTLVRFYDADSQLVYQESLSNQFVKLIPANIRRLDQTLARLVDKHLVSASLETSELTADPRKPRRPASARAETDGKAATPEDSPASGLSVRFLSSSTKPGVYLFLSNPALERVVISIRTDGNTLLYEQITRAPVDHIFLNMSGLLAGTYQVRVVSATRQAAQAVAVSYSSRAAVHRLPDKKTPGGGS